MKAQKSKIALIISFILFFTISVRCNEDVYSKEYHKEYEANKSTHLIIQNKFGKVDVNNWENNKVQIDVKVTVKNLSKEKADKILSCLNVNFSNEGNEIQAITEIDDCYNTFPRKEFSIDYTIFMPKDIQLSLANKYGNSFINEITGLADIDIKYGNLIANKMSRGNEKPLNSIVIGYGKGEIKEAGWLKTEISYSRIEIEKCQALVVNSRYSKVYVEEGSSIVSNSKYDTYQIGNINNFVSVGAYTSYKINKVNKKIKLELKYGGFKVNYMPKDFKDIDIITRYSGVSLGIDPGASYRIEGIADYGSILYPENSKVNIIKKTTSQSVSGLIGNDESTSSTVNIDTDYGSVKLIE